MGTYTREILNAPESAVINGQCRMGTFNKTIKNINLLDAHHPLGKAYPQLFTKFRLKEWEAFQITNDDYFICLAVSNIKFLGTSLLFIYDKKTEKYYSYSARGTVKKVNVPSGLFHSECSYRDDKMNVLIHNRLDEQRFDIEFTAQGDKDNPACHGNFTMNHTTEPIVIIQPFAQNKPLYSHKALMPGSGSLTVDDKTSPFIEGKASMIVDDHKGFYPYHLQYDWATTMGYSGSDLVGFNLTDNQIIDPERYNENCLWQNGRMIPLPPIKIDRTLGLKKTWKIKDKYGQVDLKFTPIAGDPIDIKVGPISFSYYGPFGMFEGEIYDDAGKPVKFDGFIGMGEKRSDKM